MGMEIELLLFEDKLRRDIKAAADLMLPEELPGITEELFGLYEKNGNRTAYERVYFRRRKFLAVFGLEAVAQSENTGYVEKCILEKLIQIIDETCAEKCWALPPHVNRTEEKWWLTVDLFASETAQTLSELSDRLKGFLPKETLVTIRENVEERVFLPFFHSPVPYRRWENSMHNWNGVCAGAIGSACLHLIEDKTRLEGYLKRICDGLQYYIKGFTEDGACTEGLSYYNYGMTYFANFAQELYDKTGGKQDLFCGAWGSLKESTEDKRAKIAAFPARCFFTDGRTLSFADGNNRGIFRMGLECVLAMHYPLFCFPDSSRAAGLDTDGCYHFAGLKMDLLMPGRLLSFFQNTGVKPEAFSEKRKNSVDVLPKAQWVIARAEAGSCMACKGGYNMEFHNHNDVGHFIYEGMGTMFLTDLGAGEYRKGYFGEGRYEVLCNRSLGHSVPLINGREQSAGEEYGCKDFRVMSGQDTVEVQMDIAGAYERGTIQKLERFLKFCLKTGKLTVTDDFLLYGEPGEYVEENLITQIPPVIEKNRVLLTDGTKVCSLTVEQAASFTVTEYEHSNHKGLQEKVYAVRWKVGLKEGTGRSTFHLILSEFPKEQSLCRESCR